MKNDSFLMGVNHSESLVFISQKNRSYTLVQSWCICDYRNAQQLH